MALHARAAELNVVVPIRFECASCGQMHEGLPDMSFAAPAHYEALPEAERAGHAALTSDTCVVGGSAFYIRGLLEIPLLGMGGSFGWGVWVSLSQPHFERFVELAGSDPATHEGPWFGWLSNRLPHYPETLNLKTHVHLRKGRLRPLIELEPTDHPLAVHQREGLELRTLLEMIGDGLHGQ